MPEKLIDLLLEKFTAYNEVMSLDASSPQRYNIERVTDIVKGYTRLTWCENTNIARLDPSLVTKEGKFFTRLCKALPRIEDLTCEKPIKVTDKFKDAYNTLVTAARADGESILDLLKIAEIYSNLKIDEYPSYGPRTAQELDYIIRSCGYLDVLSTTQENPYGKFIETVYHRHFHDFYSGYRTEKAKSEIGERIQREALEGGALNWLVSISNTIFWEDGNFGHNGSCWWGGFGESQPVFLDNGGIGLLWHDDPDDPRNGIGRCWISPLDNGRILFLFNQYGKDQNGKSIRIENTARAIARLLGEDYTANNGSLRNGASCDIPYINGNSGCYIAHKDTRTDGNFVVYWEGYENRKACANCGNYHNEDDMFYIDDDFYCEECTNDLFVSCEHCGGWTRRDKCFTANDSAYCEFCYNRFFVECEHCEQAINKRDAIKDGDGNSYCESCFCELFTACAACGDTILQDSAIQSDSGEPYCPSCYDDTFITCPDCDNETEKAESPDGIHCESCHNALIANAEIVACGRCCHQHSIDTTRLDGITTLCPACASLQADASGKGWEVQALHDPLS